MGTRRARLRSRNCIRRPPAPGGGGEWTPASLIGAIWWVRSDLGVTMDENDRVSFWEDQIDGDMSTPVSAFGGPLAGVGLNGHAELLFEGAEFLSSELRPVLGSGPRTLVAIVREVTSLFISYQHVMHYGTMDFARAYGMCHVVNAQPRWGNHYWGARLTGTTPSGVPEGRWVATSYDGTDDTVYVNGTAETTTTIALNTGADFGIQIGSRIGGPAELGRFRLYEAFVLNRALEPEDIAAISAYVLTRYGF